MQNSQGDKKMSNCTLCSAKLSTDEIGLHKKLINRGATEYMCIKCLSKEFGISENSLREKIEHFRRSGCTLFAPNIEK